MARAQLAISFFAMVAVGLVLGALMGGAHANTPALAFVLAALLAGLVGAAKEASP